MTGWELPTAVELGGTAYPIAADYRDILEIIDELQYGDDPAPVRQYVALSLFYDDFDAIPVEHREDAVTAMLWFIACGEEDDGRPGPPPVKQMDWQQDRLAIVADVNKVAGCEVRALPFLHWWTFIAYFNAIGEGQLSTLVSLREKLRRGKKLEEWERDYLARNRQRVVLQPRYTAEEKADREAAERLLRGDRGDTP